MTASVPASPMPRCLPAGDHLELPAGPFRDYPLTIREYMNSGAAPDELAQELNGAGLARLPVPVSSADITGDGKADLVVAIQDMSSSFFPTPGLLLVYACQDKGYSLVYRSGPEAGRGGPRLWLVQDLNRDKAAELFTSQASCRENACSERFQILVWNREVLENRLIGPPADFIDPQVEAADPDGDGIFDLRVTGSAAASGGTEQAAPPSVIFKFDRVSGVWRSAP